MSVLDDHSMVALNKGMSKDMISLDNESSLFIKDKIKAKKGR